MSFETNKFWIGWKASTLDWTLSKVHEDFRITPEAGAIGVRLNIMFGDTLWKKVTLTWDLNEEEVSRKTADILAEAVEWVSERM